MSEAYLHIFSSIEKLAAFFASGISENINKIKGVRPIYIALSGGSTPREIFKLLVKNHKEEINWSQVIMFWGDERCVSPASDESNYRMAYESLISKIDIPPGNIYRIEAEKDPTEESERYARIVDNLLPHKMNIPQFDVFMLGLGEDGHTASIFPGELDLFNSGKFFEVSRHPSTFQKRITATGSLINNSRQVYFLATGENKAEIVARIIDKKPGWKKLPASLVSPKDGTLSWILDYPASQLLNERSGNFHG
jgi:6-phosphogluconolactonase